MTFFKWSRTGLTNATADPTVNYAEGQAPSTLNDSARNAMAAAAKYRDDNAGAIVTGGTASNYTFSSYQVFDSNTNMNGQTIAFIPHVTNTGAQAFINVDGLGLKTLRLGTGIDVPAGTLVAGTPYRAVYNNSDGVFYLHNFFNVPYLIPIGSSLEYWGLSAPNSTFVFPCGQAISRSVYSTLFGLVSTTYGAGDGSTTFNLPDLRGRVTACTDNMGGTDANRLTTGALAAFRFSPGGAGGEASHTQTISEMPSHNHGLHLNDPGHAHNYTVVSGSEQKPASGGNPAYINSTTGTTSTNTTGISISMDVNGSGVAFNVMQPTILCNRIMRVI